MVKQNKTKQTHLTGQETEETGLDPWVEKIPLEERRRRKRQPAPVVLPGESHEQSSLAGYSPPLQATVHRVTKSRTQFK